MQAHRVVIETDDQGRPKNLDQQAQPTTGRRPPPSLAGLKVAGEVVAPAIDESDWTMGS